MESVSVGWTLPLGLKITTVRSKPWDRTGDLRCDSLNNRLRRLTADLVQLEAAQVGLGCLHPRRFPSAPTQRTVYSRRELKRFGIRLLQADEPEWFVNCLTLAGL
jgi:hypothetical protein